MKIVTGSESYRKRVTENTLLNEIWEVALILGRQDCQLDCQLGCASVRSPADADAKLLGGGLSDARFVHIPLTDTMDAVAALVQNIILLVPNFVVVQDACTDRVESRDCFRENAFMRVQESEWVSLGINTFSLKRHHRVVID